MIGSVFRPVAWLAEQFLVAGVLTYRVIIRPLSTQYPSSTSTELSIVSVVGARPSAAALPTPNVIPTASSNARHLFFISFLHGQDDSRCAHRCLHLGSLTGLLAPTDGKRL